MDETLDLLSYAEAKQKRDAILDQLEENAEDWNIDAYEAFRLHFKNKNGEEVIGEDIRVRLLKEGLRKPHHHNVWGSFVRGLATRGDLIRIGWSTMRSERAHSHPSPLYRICIKARADVA